MSFHFIYIIRIVREERMSERIFVEFVPENNIRLNIKSIEYLYKKNIMCILQRTILPVSIIIAISVTMLINDKL